MTGLGRRSDRLETTVSDSSPAQRQDRGAGRDGDPVVRTVADVGGPVAGWRQRRLASFCELAGFRLLEAQHVGANSIEEPSERIGTGTQRVDVPRQPEIDPAPDRPATGRSAPRERQVVVVACASGPPLSPPTLPRRDSRLGLAVAAVASTRFHCRLRPLADVLVQRPADVRALGEPASIVAANEPLVAAVGFHKLTHLRSHCHSLRWPLGTRIAVSACLRSSTAAPSSSRGSL